MRACFKDPDFCSFWSAYSIFDPFFEEEDEEEKEDEV
jgi:hypothetical protein